MSHAETSEDLYIYKALEQFIPNVLEEEQNCIPIDPGDRIEVSTDFVREIDGSIEEPHGWFMGRNCSKNLTGYFPGGMVRYFGRDTGRSFHRPHQYHEEDSGYSSTPGAGAPRRPHRLSETHILKPVLCFHCNDYIWGTGLVGMKCEVCGKCCHNICSTVSNNQCGRRVEVTTEQYLPVDQWSVNNVLEWMAALNLYRYADLFKTQNISGAELMQMTEERLRLMGIEDDFHLKSILVCIDELCGQNPENVSIFYRMYINSFAFSFSGRTSLIDFRDKPTFCRCVCKQINATCGSMRTADQLRKKWNEYKCQTRKKARDYHKEMYKTGGGSAPLIQITDTEQKVISLIPKCSITGIPGGTETVVSQHGTTAESENVPTAVEMIDIDNVTVTDATLGTCTSTPLPVQVTYVQQVQPEIKADGRADDAVERLVQLEEIKVELLKERVQIERERLAEERRRREIEERRLELEERRLALESNRI